jgi:hypothetical protein
MTIDNILSRNWFSFSLNLSIFFKHGALYCCKHILYCAA